MWFSGFSNFNLKMLHLGTEPYLEGANQYLNIQYLIVPNKIKLIPIFPVTVFLLETETNLVENRRSYVPDPGLGPLNLAC